MSSAKSKQRTRRRHSSNDDSPVYKKYAVSSPSPVRRFPIESSPARMRDPVDFQFQIFIPRKIVFMRVKSKSFPNTDVPTKFIRDIRKRFASTIPYETAHELITRHVNTNKCKDLHEKHAIESAEESNLGIIVKTPDNQMVGFATMYFTIRDRGEDSQIDSLFIDILCGHPDYSGVGTATLHYIKQHICEPLDIKRVELESITESIGFYLKKGFQCNPCKMRLTLKKRGKL